MRKMIKNLPAFALALSIGAGASLLGAVSLPESVSADTDYYAPVTAGGGEELLGQLHDLITTTHTYYSTYGDCRDYAPVTDPPLQETESGGGIMEFYTHETITTYIGSSNHVGRWNREHVWCKSLSNGLWRSIGNNEGGGGGDLHHIRPSEMSLNGERGDKKYGEVSGGTEAYSKAESGENSRLGGRYAGGVFEPLDSVKGDVARIVFYVYTHYNTYKNVSGTTDGESNNFRYFGTLRFTNVISAASEDAAIALLLKWNELDPVDGIETARNTAVYGIQGNRNPFIDHPEYAEMIWSLPEEPEPAEPDPVDPEPAEPDPVGPEPAEPDPKPGEQPSEPPQKSGCGGVIGGAGAAMVTIALAAAAAVLRRRK